MAKKKTELQLINELYEEYHKSNPRYKNLLTHSKYIFYLDGYNIEEEYVSDFAITVNRGETDIILVSINKTTFKEPTISREFPLSELNKTRFFSRDDAKATRNKLFKTKELNNDR